MYPAVASAEAGSYATIFVSVVYVVAPLAQLDRASGYEPEGRVFESPRAHHFPNKNSVFQCWQDSGETVFVPLFVPWAGRVPKEEAL